MRSLFLFFVIIFSSSCASIDPSEIMIDATDLNSSEVYAFIGKKVSIQKFEPEIEEGFLLMDAAFIAKYEVIEQYSGEKLPSDVQFEVYDHYGYPPFATHDIALIYLKKENGVLYHIKYRYDYVRLSKKYGWVTCGTSFDWQENIVIEPLRISLGRDCLKGNLAGNTAKARIKTGDVD